MGFCGSTSNSSSQREQLRKEKELNDMLDTGQKADEAADKRINKLLLLGAGESGKSTLFKQAINIYGSGFSVNEKKSYTSSIHANIIASIKTLVKMCPELGGGVKPENSNIAHIIDELKGDNDPSSRLTPELAANIKKTME